MNIKKIVSILMTAVLMMAIPFTSYAEEGEDYCYDENAFEEVTPEKLSELMLKYGIGLEKISLYSSGTIDFARVMVDVDSDNPNRIIVAYSTVASMVANEVGVKNLRFYKKNPNTSAETLLRKDAKLFRGFKYTYVGAYIYDTPEKGMGYYAIGNNFALFTNTEVNLTNKSPLFIY